MSKRICAKIDEYQKDGETKGKYVDIGVILSNDNGEYVIINPTIDLAGVLIRQRLMNPGKAGKGVICSIFTDEPRQNQQSQGQQSQQSQGPTDYEDSTPF